MPVRTLLFALLALTASAAPITVHGIVLNQGAIPADVTNNAAVSHPNIYVFDEGAGSRNIPTLMTSGDGTYAGNAAPNGLLPANTMVHSYLIHYDVGLGLQTVGSANDWVEFDQPILGIIIRAITQDLTDFSFGNEPATTYTKGVGRDLEATDSVAIAGKRLTLLSLSAAGISLDQIRVLVAVPEPGAAGSVLVAVAGIVSLRRRTVAR